MDYLEVGDLRLSGDLDDRGQMIICSEDVYIPIDKERAKIIIAHMADLFDINLITIPIGE